jgi:hypothetical protein
MGREKIEAKEQENNDESCVIIGTCNGEFKPGKYYFLNITNESMKSDFSSSGQKYPTPSPGYGDR